jgi:hypothetical protein
MTPDKIKRIGDEKIFVFPPGKTWAILTRRLDHRRLPLLRQRSAIKPLEAADLAPTPRSETEEGSITLRRFHHGALIRHYFVIGILYPPLSKQRTRRLRILTDGIRRAQSAPNCPVRRFFSEMRTLFIFLNRGVIAGILGHHRLP